MFVVSSAFWVSYAVVIIADLIAMGVALGLTPRYSPARPAMCGDDIEVPDRKSQSRPPLGPGATAAMTLTPGAVMSGLSRSLSLDSAGPREEKLATWGTGVGAPPVVSPGVNVAVGAVVVAYVLMAAPATSSTWTVGTTCRSESRLPGETLVRIIPTPPAALTAADLSVRAMTPRSQTTILPVTLAGSSTDG